MKVLLFVFATVIILACAKSENPSTWSSEQLSSSIALCKQELLDPPARTDEASAARMCTCYIDVIREKYSYTDYEKRAQEIDTELSNQGKLDACFK